MGELESKSSSVKWWNLCEAEKKKRRKKRRWCEYGCDDGLSSEAQHVTDSLIEQQYVTLQVSIVSA